MNKNERIIQIALELARMEPEEYERVKSQLLEQVVDKPKLKKLVEIITTVVEGGS